MSWRKNHYRSIADETKTMEICQEGNGPFHIYGAKEIFFKESSRLDLIFLNAGSSGLPGRQ